MNIRISLESLQRTQIFDPGPHHIHFFVGPTFPYVWHPVQRPQIFKFVPHQNWYFFGAGPKFDYFWSDVQTLFSISNSAPVFFCRAEMWIHRTRFAKTIRYLQLCAAPRIVVVFVWWGQSNAFDKICEDNILSSSLGHTHTHSVICCRFQIWIHVQLWALPKIIFSGAYFEYFWQDLQRPGVKWTQILSLGLTNNSIHVFKNATPSLNTFGNYNDFKNLQLCAAPKIAFLFAGAKFKNWCVKNLVFKFGHYQK